MENNSVGIGSNLISQDKPELYDLMDQGKTYNVPGIDLEYEAPTDAKLNFNPEENATNIDKILAYLIKNKVTYN